MLNEMMKLFKNFFLFYAAVIVTACNNDDSKPETSLPGSVYCDYKILGNEDSQEVNCLLQFKQGGPSGSSLALQEPANVKLDGEALQADSAGFSGVFYEAVKPLQDFSGKHTIIFTDAVQRIHKTEFEFTLFSLAEEIVETVKSKPFTIKLKNFPPGKTPLRVMLTDTAFATNDVNEIVPVAVGKLTIDPSMLNKLKAGPIALELIQEEERPIGKGKRDRGKILISYGLRRVFQLVD